MKLYMKPTGDQLSFPDKAREIGIDPHGMTRQQLTKAVRSYFVEVVHEGDVQSYLASDCFKGMCVAISVLVIRQYTMASYRVMYSLC